MDAKKIANDYFRFVKENTQFYTANSGDVEVVTPYVDTFGDGITFVVIQEGDKFKVTDKGFTLWNLENVGLDLLKKKSPRNMIFNSLLNYTGFSLDNQNSIYRETTKNRLGQTIHDLTQLLLNVYDFVYTGSQRVRSFFFDDVKEYFSNNRETYMYLPDFSIVGKSRLSHHIDYVFMRKNQANLVKLHNTLTKQQVDATLAIWLDTADKRQAEYGNTEKMHILLSHDGFARKKDSHVEALEQYGISVLDFSDKKTLEKVLANA